MSQIHIYIPLAAVVGIFALLILGANEDGVGLSIRTHVNEYSSSSNNSHHSENTMVIERREKEEEKKYRVNWRKRCEKLSEVAEKGDPTGLITLTTDEYRSLYEVLELPNGEFAEEGQEEEHPCFQRKMSVEELDATWRSEWKVEKIRSNVVALVARVPILQQGSVTIYEEENSGIEELLGKIEEALRRDDEARDKDDLARRRDDEALARDDEALRRDDIARSGNSDKPGDEGEYEDVHRRALEARRRNAEAERRFVEARRRDEEARRRRLKSRVRYSEARLNEATNLQAALYAGDDGHPMHPDGGLEEENIAEEEVLRADEEARRRDDEARKLDDEARRKDDEARKVDSEARKWEDEKRRKQQERMCCRKIDSEERRRSREARRRGDEAGRRASEALRREAETRARESARSGTHVVPPKDTGRRLQNMILEKLLPRRKIEVHQLRTVGEVLALYAGDDQHPVRRAIRACKKYIMKVFSTGGLAHYLRVHHFIRNGVTDPQGYFVALAKLYRVSILQSAYLDAEVDKQLVEMHFGQKKIRKDGESVVALVVGGGPSGLWASLHAFKAGFNVVNAERNCIGDFQRNRALRLDSIWLERLRWFLGTIFDENCREVVNGVESEWPVIYIDTQQFALYIDIYQLERLLRERLQALTDSLPKVRPPLAYDNAKLELLVGAEVPDLLFPGAEAGDVNERSRFRAIIRVCQNCGVSKEVRVKVTRYQKFDVLINAAGASRNILRNLYNGVSVPYNKRQAFFVAVAERRSKMSFAKKRFYVNADEAQMSKFAELSKYFHASDMNAIVHSFAKTSTGGSSRSGTNLWCEAEDTMEEYRNLGDMFDAEKLVRVTAIYNQHRHLRIAGYPPMALEKFNNSLTDELERRGWVKGDKEWWPCNELRTKVNDYFFAAVMRLVGERAVKDRIHELDPTSREFINVGNRGEILPGTDFHLQFDGNNIHNRQIFNVVQWAVPLSAVYYYIGGEIIISDVLGDARVDPHFASTSGMTTARCGIEGAIDVLATDYPSWPERELDEQVAKQIVKRQNNEVLDPVKEDALARGRPIVNQQIDDPARRDELCKRKALRFIDLLNRKRKSHTASEGATGEEPVKFGFQIECFEPLTSSRSFYDDSALQMQKKYGEVCVSPDQPSFKLRLHGGAVLEAKVTRQGKILSKIQRMVYNIFAKQSNW